MPQSTPTVYMLHGADEFGITQFIRKMEAKLGDPSSADMNIKRFEGSQLSLEDLQSSASAMPFLAPRRLVIVNQPTKKIKTDAQKERFQSILDNLPPTTALVLVEPKSLSNNNWLLKWSRAAKENTFIKEFSPLKSGQMVAHLRKHALDSGGEITSQAASFLVELAGEDLRAATMEVDKLLTYVNFQRPVEVDDVENLAAFANLQGDFFKMIDAIARSDGRNAINMLYRLLQERDPLSIYFSLVSNYRLLLLVREVLDQGGSDKLVADKLSIHPYRAKKLASHARNISIASLEHTYHQLFEYDQQIKTGQIGPELALDMLVVSLTSLPV